jgi:hypothetical protein
VNYEDRSVVIGRMIPTNREITTQNVSMGSKMSKIGEFYEGVSEGFKSDLKSYTKKMYKLKAFKKGLAGNTYSTFVKMLWEASKNITNPIDLDSLSIDDLSLGSYSVIDSVKAAVENDMLPTVRGYEVYTNGMAI